MVTNNAILKKETLENVNAINMVNACIYKNSTINSCNIPIRKIRIRYDAVGIAIQAEEETDFDVLYVTEDIVKYFPNDINSYFKYIYEPEPENLLSGPKPYTLFKNIDKEYFAIIFKYATLNRLFILSNTRDNNEYSDEYYAQSIRCNYTYAQKPNFYYKPIRNEFILIGSTRTLYYVGYCDPNGECMIGAYPINGFDSYNTFIQYIKNGINIFTDSNMIRDINM